MGIFLILLLMVAALSIYTPSFSTQSNAVSIIQAIAPIAIMGIGQTYVILTAGIDLSVGSVCALSAYCMSAVLTAEAGYPLWLGVLAALGAGTACGLFSGLVITKLRVTPFIVTLGMLSACSGLTLGLSGGKQIGLNKFGHATVLSESILDPAAVLEGEPEAERRYYSESGESVDIVPMEGGGAWLAATEPSAVYRVNAQWEATAKVEFEESGIGHTASTDEGGLLVSEAAGFRLWKVSPEGAKSLVVDSTSGNVAAVVAGKDDRYWIATNRPAELLQIDGGGQDFGRLALSDLGEVASLAYDSERGLLVTTTRPGSIAKVELNGKVEGLYRNEAATVFRAEYDEAGNIWFLEGEEEPVRLGVVRNKKAAIAWETPKPPIRDFLLFPGEVAIVSTGNVGALYRILPGREPNPIHPMTRFKARALAKGPDDETIFVANAGPAGISTLSTTATRTAYPVAESFNSLYEWAPWTMAALVVLASVFLRYSTWGTYLFAIGGNETAARLSGVKVERIKIFAYALTGLLAALASVFMTSKLHTLDPNLAKGYELKVIAAVVIGGTSLMGGEGSVWGTLLGACLLYVLNYALVHLGMEDIWSDLFIGAIIIFAAVLDSTRSRLPQMVERLKRVFSSKV
jgi:ribose/xylose/arabinose/galactoside ABC-type transport system permease subunit